MSDTNASKLERTDWERENNSNFVTILDPEMGGLEIKVESELLIFPDEFADFINNHRLRRLAIEQGVFKAYSIK